MQVRVQRKADNSYDFTALDKMAKVSHYPPGSRNYQPSATSGISFHSIGVSSSREGRKRVAKASYNKGSDQMTTPTSGKPLSPEISQTAGQHFGWDFSNVRIYLDNSPAESSSQSLGALAYTYEKNNIVFRAGQYNPHTTDGQRLLAHELTHVIQQNKGRVGGIQLHPQGMLEEDPFEREAEEVGTAFSRRRRFGSTPSYREAMQLVLPPVQKPAAAQLHDTRATVLQSERPMFNDLRGFLQGLPGSLRQLVSTGNASELWLSANNPNIQSALRVLDQLVDDLNGERFVVRFDQPSGSNVSASYDFLNDEMHLKPFSGASHRTLIAIDLLHEYAHLLQDNEAERIFARQQSPIIHTREEDLQREIAARREQVYFGEMLRLIGAPVPTEAIFGEQLSNMVFRSRFETERTGKTLRERSGATREIRHQIESNYSTQLQKIASIKTYIIEIESNNHARLFWNLAGRGRSVDLGGLSPQLTDLNQLKGQLEARIRALPEFASLFTQSRGQPFSILTFMVTHGGDLITEFGFHP